MESVLANVKQRRLLLQGREQSFCTAKHGPQYTDRTSDFRYVAEDCKRRAQPRARPVPARAQSVRPESSGQANRWTAALFRRFWNVPFENMDEPGVRHMKLMLGVNKFVQSSLAEMLRKQPRDPAAEAGLLLHKFIDGQLEEVMTRVEVQAAVRDLLNLYRVATRR